MSQPLNLDALERDALTHGKLSWKDAHALVSHARSLAYQIARLQAAAPSASTEKCFKCGHPAHSDSCVNVAPSAQQVEQLPVELRAVAETVAEGGGFWATCTGCYDTEDGRPTQKYAHSDVFGCELGNGCRECGGIGAVWDDTDYAEMAEFMMKDDAAPAPKLAVWYGAMPESNGKSNWTAILHTGDIAEGFTIDRSEYPDRVRYEADRVRHLIGELAEKPFILDYDAAKRDAEPNASPEPVAGESRLVTLARENTVLLDALVYVAHMMHAEPQHRCCKGLTLIDNNGVEVKLPDGRVVGGYESPTASLSAATDDRPVIKALKEPVSVEKAMLAGRTARAETSVQGSAAVFLVNIQIAGWTESKEYAEGFARGFNLAAKWMQSALRGYVPAGYRLQPISEFDAYQDVLREAARYRIARRHVSVQQFCSSSGLPMPDLFARGNDVDVVIDELCDAAISLDAAMSPSKEGA